MRFPSSLVARVLKASYFLVSDILSTTNMSYASSVLRWLMLRRGLINKGSRWRIGSGASVDARSGRWIPRTAGFTVREPHRIPKSTTVAELKTPEGYWNIPLHRDCCRSRGRGAHLLAKKALLFVDHVVWEAVVPPDLVELCLAKVP